MAVLSKGIKLFYKTKELADYIELTNLQEIPDLGGTAESVEITTLADPAHMYMDGILNYGDSLGFKFLYDRDQYLAIQALEGELDWKVNLPDETMCKFSGTCSAKLDGIGVNGALTYTLAIKPSSKMDWLTI